jgi:hypothetical protein
MSIARTESGKITLSSFICAIVLLTENHHGAAAEQFKKRESSVAEFVFAVLLGAERM